MEPVLLFMFLLAVVLAVICLRWMARKDDPVAPAADEEPRQPYKHATPTEVAAADGDREAPQAVSDPAADQKNVIKSTLIVIAILLLGGWALYNILQICIHLKQVDSEKMQARADNFLGFSGGRNSGNDKALTTRERAESGDAEAQYKMGLCATDHRQEVYWLQMAADQGHAGAQYRLGSCYYFGRGVEEDRKMAEYWLRKSAAQHNGDAKMMLKTFFGPYRGR